MSTPSTPRPERSHLRRIGLISLGVLLVVLAAAWLSRPPLATGTVLDFDVDRISDEYPAVALQLSMAGYVAMVDDGVAVYDAETGETAASDGYVPPEGATRPATLGSYVAAPEVIQISEDGTALAREDTSSDSLKLIRLTEDGERPVRIPDEVWRGESPKESDVLASAPDRLTVAGCLYDDTAAVAGLDPADLSVQWRHEATTDFCSLSSMVATTDRYAVSPLGGYAGAEIIDTRTGDRRQLPVSPNLTAPVSIAVHDDTAAVLQDQHVTGVDAATGQVRWRASVCDGFDLATWSTIRWDGPQRQPRYVAATCQSLEQQDRVAEVVVDLEDGRVGPQMSPLDLQSSSYLDGGEAPEEDDQTVDDVDRPVSALLVDGTVVTRVGARVSGSDPFTGDERWVRDLDVEESHVVSLKAAGAADAGMLMVLISGDERQETMLWDPTDGSTLVHTRGDEQSLQVDGEGQILLEDDYDYRLVQPADRS